MVRFTREQKRIIERFNKISDANWIDNHNGTITCDKCHTWFNKDDRYNYMHHCPNCGAKMESEDKE